MPPRLSPISRWVSWQAFLSGFCAALGSDFSPFTAFLSVNQNCSTIDRAGVMTATTATFTHTMDNGVNTDIGTANGGTAYVCFQADGTTLINAQTLAGSTTVDLFNPVLLDPISPYLGTLLPMVYNGSVVKVETINPAGNTTAQSFLRITNPGAVEHEMYIMGLPAGSDFSLLVEVDQWIKGGQVGPAPLQVNLLGGIQSLPPGDTAVLALTLKAGYTYQFADYTGATTISALASTS